MKRLLAVSTSFLIVLGLGCTHPYQVRLDESIRREQYKKRLNQFLSQEPEKSLRDAGIFLRPPKPLSKADQLIDLNVPDPAAYEVAASFIDRGAGGGAADKKGGEPSPVKLHILARIKRPKRPTKKGEAPPPKVQRGDFRPDIRNILANTYGAPDVADTAKVPAKKIKKGDTNEFEKMDFKASNQDDIHVYLYKQGEYDVAYVWDVPAAAEKSPTAVTGIDLCLESTAVGPTAIKRFEGGSEDEQAGPEGEGANPEAGPVN